jgi:3-oxoacyl-[acyl-carrier-protein] synthase-3
MKFDDLYFSGLGTWLPPAMTGEQAVRAGLCERELLDATGMSAVAVDDSGVVPAEMAARAARIALERSGATSGDVGLILYAHLYDQGNELWSAASYLQRRVVGNRCPAIELRQVSNGGMAGLDLATAHLAARPESRSVLICSADRFAEPGFDRWRTDPGTVYADGGVAAVLTRGHGFARLASLVLVSDPDLEGMHRGGEAHGVGLVSTDRPLDLGAHKRNFLRQVGRSYPVGRVAAGQRQVVETALAEAGCELEKISRVVLPRFGRRRLETNFLRNLGLTLEHTTWDWNRSVGHLGAGDLFAGLEHIVTSGTLEPGDRCLLLGVGAGFTWWCAVVEICGTPDALGV